MKKFIFSLINRTDTRWKRNSESKKGDKNLKGMQKRKKEKKKNKISYLMGNVSNHHEQPQFSKLALRFFCMGMTIQYSSK
jgi:hypothetical protein